MAFWRLYSGSVNVFFIINTKTRLVLASAIHFLVINMSYNMSYHISFIMFDKLLDSEKERCCLQSSMSKMLWLKKPSFTRVIQRKVDFCFKQNTLLIF